MPDIALARSCPQCGSLITCPGAFTDRVLRASCHVCAAQGRPIEIEIANPRYVSPAKAENQALKAALEPFELENENRSLRDRLKKFKPDADPGTNPTAPPPALEEGKHSGELVGKYFDNTGETSNAPLFPTSEPQKKDKP